MSPILRLEDAQLGYADTLVLSHFGCDWTEWLWEDNAHAYTPGTYSPERGEPPTL